jgi:hypothetical protein
LTIYSYEARLVGDGDQIGKDIDAALSKYLAL